MFSSLVTSWMVFSIFIGRCEIATGSRTIFVHGAVSIFADTTRETDTLVAVFHFSALHAAIRGIKIHSVLNGNFPDAIGLSFAPIKCNTKIRATGTTAQTGMLFG